MKGTWWVKQEQLNEEQKAIFALPLGGYHLVTGPPGSGKTNLLLLRAKYLTLAGKKNFAVVVFTRALQDFIAAGAQHYAVDATKVMTSRRLLGDLLYDAGVSDKAPEEFEEQRRFFIERLKALIDEKKIDKHYQAILLDEGQDYLPDEIDIFSKLCDSLFVVADARQQIYKGSDTVAHIKKFIGGPQQHVLKYHYRNGHKICVVADAIATNWSGHVPLSTFCNYDEEANPSSVDAVRSGSLDDQAQLVINRLSIQLRTFPDELLGVCAPRAVDLEHIWRRLAASHLAARGNSPLIHWNPAERGAMLPPASHGGPAWRWADAKITLSHPCF